MPVRVDRRWRVAASDAIRIPLPASTVWGQMRDWRRFLTLDPLHRNVIVHPATRQPLHSPKGLNLAIRHELLGFRVDRAARILTWDEGRGYAISDLSRRGPRRAFPHVCTYRVDPAGPGGATITIGVRGVWTARFVPRPLVRLWIAWVLGATRSRILREMHDLAAWRRAQEKRAARAARS